MKIKSLLAAGAMGLGLAGVANAATFHVYITGSTAFRPCIFQTLTNQTPGLAIFNSTPTVAAGGCSAVGTLDPHTASQMVFTGNIGANTYIIKCAWSGSEAGISDACGNSSKVESFIADSASGVQTAKFATPDSHTVDIAMADNDQGFSLTQSPSLSGANVGVVPFVWVKNAQTNAANPTAPAAWLRLTNVNDPGLRVALSGGSPISAFTANNADTNYVYVAGRDNQSGTFVNTMLDTQFGLGAIPSQIEIATNGPGVAFMSPNHLLNAAGPSGAGQSSGGTLSVSMTYLGTSTNVDFVQTANAGKTIIGFYAIAYLGLPDAAVCFGTQGPIPASGGPAVALTYNGVAETPANIENGTYSFWGNEWLYQSANNLEAGASTIVSDLENNIPANCEDVSFFNLNDMDSVKATSGADPAHN